MNDWRASPKIALVVFLLLLATQFAIPVSRVGSPDTPQRWAWQMFSKPPHHAQFYIETSSRRHEVAIGQYMARLRGDIDLTIVMPQYLCAVHGEATRITWDEESHECSTG